MVMVVLARSSLGMSPFFLPLRGASGSRPSLALQRSSPSKLEDERPESVSSLCPALYDGNEESRYKKKFSSKKWGRRESSETTHDEAQPQKEQLMMRHSPKINFFDLLYFAFFSSKSCTFLELSIVVLHCCVAAVGPSIEAHPLPGVLWIAATFTAICFVLIHKLTGVAIALKTTSVWQNHPGFDHNIEGWTVFGKGAIKERISNASSRFIVAHNRTHPLDSFSQKVQLKKGMLYTFSNMDNQKLPCRACDSAHSRYISCYAIYPTLTDFGNFWVSLRSIVHIWVMSKKGPLYVAMFKPIGIIFAVIMGIAFLGDSIYLGSVLGAAIAVIGFYAVIWGKSQEQAKEECEVYDDSESYSPVVPLLENKRMEE
ncbi:WAT1-related protein [Glycine soja]|nr:WAT1-related protein [Glycine soja]